MYFFNRKFDGVAFRLNRNNGFSLVYDGGLNGSNKICSPLHKQVTYINGDSCLPDDDQE